MTEDSTETPPFTVESGAIVTGHAEHPDPAKLTAEERRFLGIDKEGDE